MKSIIRLLLISLSVVCAQDVSAHATSLSLQANQEIKSYVAAAQALGFSNEEVKAAFVKALETTDAHGTVTLSLTHEYKKIALIAGGVTAVAALGGIVYLGYAKRDGKIPFGKFWNNSEVNSGNPIDPIDPVIEPIAPEVIPLVGRSGATRYALRNTTRVNYKE